MNLLLTNANVYTVHPHQPRASAIAIANDRILAVGSDAEIENIRLPNVERIDLRGAFVLPGLIDAHVHLEWTGFAMLNVEIDEVPSVDEAVRRVKERASQTPKGRWIQGHGWAQGVWTPSRFPTANELDAATRDHPVALRAKSGHALWANSLAMRLAGIDANTPNPIGGEIVHDERGNPTGVFLETAENLILNRIPYPTTDDEDEAVLVAMRAMNKVGLTGVHCMDGKGGIETFKTYQRLREQRKSTLRVVKMVPVQSLDDATRLGIRSGFGDAWLRIGGVKIFTDGALGPKTAWMVEPYENEPENFGIPIWDKEELIDFIVRSHKNGLSVTVHAIGDRANREILDAIEVSRKTNDRSTRPIGQSGQVERRWTNNTLRDRIEHAQVLQPDDISRFAELNLITSVQPIHATSDMKMVDANWGKRSRYAYAFRSLWDSGARFAFGSDTPVETFDPLVGIHAAVTRRRKDGSPGVEGWHPEQRLTIEEAIYGYTMGAAYAGYMEREVGSIESGKLADLTILTRDLTRIDPNEILDVKVDRVMVGGEWR